MSKAIEVAADVVNSPLRWEKRGGVGFWSIAFGKKTGSRLLFSAMLRRSKARSATMCEVDMNGIRRFDLGAGTNVDEDDAAIQDYSRIFDFKCKLAVIR